MTVYELHVEGDGCVIVTRDGQDFELWRSTGQFEQAVLSKEAESCRSREYHAFLKHEWERLKKEMEL